MGLWDQRKLLHLAILKLLIPNVGSDCLLVPAHRRDEISTRPELVPREVLRLSLDILCDPNRAFALMKPITSATEYFGGIETSMWT